MVLAPREQEEMQLILDEAAATPYAKAEAKLVSNDPQRTGPRIDRRDPLWRQKHFRAEGVHYYASVSLFRAGEFRGAELYRGRFHVPFSHAGAYSPAELTPGALVNF